MKTICLYGGPVFDGTWLLPMGAVTFNRSEILEVSDRVCDHEAAESYDVGGQMIVPGFVDLHSDIIEKCIEMRPGVFFDVGFALRHLDQRLAASGITTFCHALSFADNELGLRCPEEAESIVRAINRFNKSERSCVRHRVHARFEIGSERSAEAIMRLIDDDQLALLSLMDHTPGQGQFKTLRAYLDFYATNYKLREAEVMAFANEKMANRENHWTETTELAALAFEKGIPVLSHDDDTPEKVDWLKSLHVSGCEFPVSLDAAIRAAENELSIFMGAPNLIRGVSSNGNLKAAETIRAGLCNGLISDYYPESLLQAPFVAAEMLPVNLAAALQLTTSGPSDFLPDGHLHGRLAPGARADLVVIDTVPDWKKVTQTWVGGEQTYCSTVSRKGVRL